MAKQPKLVQFEQVIDALLDNSTPFPPTYLHRFSDLHPNDLKKLKNSWSMVNPERRVALLLDLEDLSETDTLVNFDDLARFALDDTDPRARAAAIRLLWETQDEKLIPIFINKLREDPDELVRSAAATGLGLFVYLGELEDIDEELLHTIEDVLLQTLQGTDTVLVRRHALESLGYSGRGEIPDLIRKAYNTAAQDWVASALFAMGRTADSVWETEVKESLDHHSPEVQLEAVRAAGSLSITSARPALLKMLKHPEDVDEEVLYAAVWSLSEIGGDSVQEAFDHLMENNDDDEMVAYIEDALENLEFTDSFPIFDLMDVDSENEDDLENVVDLEEDEDDEDDQLV
jgi:HEAT repeat protein